MEKSCESPEILVSAEFSRVGAGASLHRKSVFTQAFTLRVLTQKLPGIVTGWHSFLNTMLQDEAHEKQE
jgi:hypothetical protein